MKCWQFSFLFHRFIQRSENAFHRSLAHSNTALGDNVANNSERVRQHKYRLRVNIFFLVFIESVSALKSSDWIFDKALHAHFEKISNQRKTFSSFGIFIYRLIMMFTVCIINLHGFPIPRSAIDFDKFVSFSSHKFTWNEIQVPLIKRGSGAIINGDIVNWL